MIYVACYTEISTLIHTSNYVHSNGDTIDLVVTSQVIVPYTSLGAMIVHFVTDCPNELHSSSSQVATLLQKWLTG